MHKTDKLGQSHGQGKASKQSRRTERGQSKAHDAASLERGDERGTIALEGGNCVRSEDSQLYQAWTSECTANGPQVRLLA